MSNPPKQKGTTYETALVNWFHEGGHHHIERRALSGTNDRGDLAGVKRTVLEAKNVQKLNLAGWVDEAVLEAKNAHADVGVVLVKRKGKGDPGQSYAVLPLHMLERLLIESGRL